MKLMRADEADAKVDQDMRIMQALQNEPSTRALLGKYKQIGLDNGKPLFKHVDRQLFLQPTSSSGRHLSDKYKISDFVFAMDADSSATAHDGNTFATFYPKRSQNTLNTAHGEDIGDAGPPTLTVLCSHSYLTPLLSHPRRCALTLSSRYFLTISLCYLFTLTALCSLLAHLQCASFSTTVLCSPCLTLDLSGRSDTQELTGPNREARN